VHIHVIRGHVQIHRIDSQLLSHHITPAFRGCRPLRLATLTQCPTREYPLQAYA
jgi:hypothetical protein